MLMYPVNLIKQRAELNTIDEAWGAIRLQPLDSNQKVLDLIASESSKPLKNVGRCFVAK